MSGYGENIGTREYKERRLQLDNKDVITTLENYKTEFSAEIVNCHIFCESAWQAIIRSNCPKDDKRYSAFAAIDLHITPHTFRHTPVTSLLETDEDIRYIQEMLGDSSINITEIYTHVAVSKQWDILTSKYPRKDFNIL